MSQQIYRFIKFLEQKEGREPPPQSIIKYGNDDEFNNISEDDLLDMVKKDGLSIALIINRRKTPSEELQIAAIEQNIKSIDFIDMSNPNVKKAAYDKYIKYYNGRIPFWLKSYFD